MSDDYDYLFKCICVGDGGCGKTALVIRFSQGYFQEQYKLTIGVEFAVKTIDLPEINKKIKLQIWDTGGQERFQYVRPLYYRGSMGAILLFDLTNRESFDHIAKWIEEVKDNAGDIPMLLVGNKKDLVDERKVSRAEAEEFAEEMEMYYVESSAKDGTGVGDVFAVLSCLMIGVEVPDDYLETPTVGESTGPVAAGEGPVPSQDLSSVPPPQPISMESDNIPPPAAAGSSGSDDALFNEAISHTENQSMESDMLPSAFSEGEDEDEIPPFEQETPTPAPQPVDPQSPESQDEELFNIPSVPKKKKSTLSQPMVFDEEPESEPEPQPTEIQKPKISSVQFSQQKEEDAEEEWSIPDIQPSKPETSDLEAPSLSAKSIPAEDEIEASIPSVPQKKKPQTPITFDEPTETADTTSSAAPPLEFTKPKDIPSEDLQPFGKPAGDESWTPMPESPETKEQPGPITFDKEPEPEPRPTVSKPITFPNAKPAEAPPEFKRKKASNPIFGAASSSSSQPKAKPFSAPFTSEKQKKAKKESGAMNTFLGALGSKTKGTTSENKSKKGFTPFASFGSSKKKPSAGFIPKSKNKGNSVQLKEIGSSGKSEPSIIRPASSTAVKSKSKKRKRRKKKRNKKQDIIICPTCGAIVNAKYKFCNKCGTKL